MGYAGDTYRIGFERGGLVGAKNLDALEPTDMIEGTRNINLHKNTRKKRGGSAHVNTAAYATAPQIMGVHDFGLRSGTRFIMAACKDGKVYKDNTNTIKTGMSTTNFFKFTTFLNTLYICDGATTPQSWNGTAAGSSNISTSASDWTGSNQPQGFIVHGVGNTERLWAFGCPTTPHRIYAAKDSTDNFNDVDATVVDIETEDGFGIVAAIEYGDRLFCFGKTKAFKIDDSDSTIANWGYDGAQWYGGVAHWRLICRTPNDIIAMMEDGEIYSVTAAETYGDYRAASLLRPADMNSWLGNGPVLASIDPT